MSVSDGNKKTKVGSSPARFRLDKQFDVSYGKPMSLKVVSAGVSLVAAYARFYEAGDADYRGFGAGVTPGPPSSSHARRCSGVIACHC